MLTQLATVKARLEILDTDTTYDALLTGAIKAISARFDNETRRTLARTENGTFEFPADAAEIPVPCYPVEAVTKFETKSTEAEGWVEQTGLEYLIRSGCVISLTSAICHVPSSLARITYTGGYVEPGGTVGAGQTALPADLEQAVIEQTAYWFQNRDKVGVIRYWPKGGVYEQFADLDLLPSVRAALAGYRRAGI